MYFAKLFPILMELWLQAPSQTIAKAFEDLDHWQLEAASDTAENLLCENPNDPLVQLLNAEVLHQQGRHETALALWRSSHIFYPARADVIGPRIWASAAYAPYFQTDASQHFEIHYMDKDVVIAALATQILEVAYQRFGKLLDFYPAEAGQKIVVEIYPDAQGLAGATGLTFREIQTSGTIAVCKFHRIMILSPLATLRGYAWADTLAHEFVHLMISKKSKNTIPVWLHEGIAKYLETQWRLDKAPKIAPYQQDLLAKALHANNLVSLQRMHPSMAKLASQDEATLAFAEVFTLVGYLQDHYGIASIAQLLQNSARTGSLDSALKQTLGVSLSTLEKRWLKSLRAQKFTRVPNAQKPKIELVSNDNPVTETISSTKQIDDKPVHDHARLGELLQLRAHTAAAILEYEKAMGQHPEQYPDICNQLARLYMQTERFDEALKLVHTVLKTTPDAMDAQLIAGRIELQRNHWEQAKTHYEAARLQNPYQPEIPQALARIYTHLQQPDKAKQQATFAKWCEQPRPQQNIVVPQSDHGSVCPQHHGKVRMVHCPEQHIQIDKMPEMQTPIWDLCLSEGTHQYRQSKQAATPTMFQITNQQTQTLRSASHF